MEMNKPMILIANHPNTLMDALMIGIISPRPVYYMTKATYFNRKWKMKLLRSINMIPINRSTESKIDGVDNDSVFEECYQLLAEGKTLVIFPEGNSQMEWSLRKLKSGTARIALETELRNGGKLDLRIVPIGLMYMQGEKFRSNVLVNFGEGISVTNHLETYKVNKSLAAKHLTAEMTDLLENVLVTTQNKEQEAVVFSLVEHLQSRYLHNAETAESELELIRKVRDNINRLTMENPKRLEEIQQLLWNLNWKASKLAIRKDFLDRGLRSSLFIRQIFTSIIALVIGFPVFLLGFLFNFIPHFLTGFLLRDVIKISREFYAPVSVIISLFLHPLTYLVFSYFFYHLFEPPFYVVIMHFFLMPFLGLFSLHFANYLKHISYKVKYTFLLMNNRNLILEMKEQRQLLFKLLFE